MSKCVAYEYVYLCVCVLLLPREALTVRRKGVLLKLTRAKHSLISKAVLPNYRGTV